MAAPTVFEDVSEGFGLDGAGQLFAGKKFWVAQRVPSRNRLLDDIKANGGEIVLLEKKADYRIADHFRKDCPPGTISYEFVEKSIQEGQLRDPEDHRAGPPLGEAREPGAINRPTKGGRAAYDAEEDRILYKWVRDCEANGGQASGNEIYKQLEAKYPRHTWQSWRDRYLKQLRTRPPTAFNVPDNAPPSPPSDNSAEQTRAATSASGQDKQAAAKQEQSLATNKATGLGRSEEKARAKPDYTLDQLAATFSPDDWEELYAFVAIIDETEGENERLKAWEGWAELQDNQTAEQWRQYYDKVVRPQWLRDPEWKRKQITEKVEKKHEDDKHASQTMSQLYEGLHNEAAEATGVASTVHELTQSTEEAPKPSVNQRVQERLFENLLEARGTSDSDNAAAYVLYAREKKWSTWNAQPELDYTNLHKLLMSEWEALSDDFKAPYVAMHQTTNKRAQIKASKLASEVKLMSSSTAQHESPKYISEMYQNALKRVRGDDVAEAHDESGKQSRPSKRQKSISPVFEDEKHQEASIGTQQQPVEISSVGGSVSDPEERVEDDQVNDQILQDIELTQRGDQVVIDSDMEEAEKEVESIESDEFLDIDQLVPPLEESEEFSEDDLPSNTPTPRASRQRPNNFDTQAILSSPSQSIGITSLPRPVGYTQDLQAQPEDRSSSLAPHPESDASTTQSLQEFRRSLNNEDITQPSYPTLNSLPRARSLSLTPSNASSNDSGDPDMPLSASEINDFFSEQNAEGFSDDFIAAALKRTRCRPALAEVVLEAWKDGQPLPYQRGIWSLEDDEAAESGDGVALAKLERKHTLDGWGGITERLKFLDGYRSR